MLGWLERFSLSISDMVGFHFTYSVVFSPHRCWAQHGKVYIYMAIETLRVMARQKGIIH